MSALATDLLERNLSALALGSPRAAEQIRRAPPRPDLALIETPDGAASGSIDADGTRLLLASARRPLDEARRFVDAIPIDQSPLVAVVGFGLGHHVRLLSDRLAGAGLGIVFEPDVSLLRAVFERIDHSAWLRAGRIAVLTSPDAAAELHRALQGKEALPFMGRTVLCLDHPPSRSRLTPDSARFREMLAGVIAALRTTVTTTLVQSPVTVRNLLMNVGHYASGAGIDDLTRAAADRPAIVVAAGPSLRRNVDLLARPGVRDRFVIIAAQTALRTLLERGVRPHFVTALDYHEISRRFYEGLTPDAVEGVQLVVEPKANPAILDAFPGVVRCTGDAFLDDLLGPDITPRRRDLPPGATVAHLSYYLARHLGCDPVILIGQDLGFTDGQYYASGAAIHRVWACELNPFRTLEMMEWERVVRGRFRLKGGQPNLRRVTDVLGRPIYTDEQMATYLAQFERDFLADQSVGRTTIDATEGGVAKRHTVAMSLHEAMERHRPGSSWTAPTPPARSRAGADALAARVAEVRQQVWRVGDASRRTVELLSAMLEHQRDQERVNRLIDRVHAVRDEVERLEPGYSLVQVLNQPGALGRERADRAIELDRSLSPMDRQKRQIDRDIANVRWIEQAAHKLASLLDAAGAALRGLPKLTRDPVERADDASPARPAGRAHRVAALVPIRPDQLERFDRDGPETLRRTLARLNDVRALDRVVLLAHDPARARHLAGSPDAVVVEVPAAALADRHPGVRAARLWAARCWRGGLAGATCHDELLLPGVMARVMEEQGIDAAAVAGPDWPLLDPALAEALVQRYLEAPASHRVTFAQAPPGLAPCVIDRSVMTALARAEPGSGPFATLGALLGYVPAVPALDLIGRPCCVAVEPEVRDLGARLIADNTRSRALIDAIGDARGAPEIARAARTALAPDQPRDSWIAERVLEVGRPRALAGLRAAWHEGAAPAGPIARDEREARAMFERWAAAGEDWLLTIGGLTEPLDHADVPAIVRAARDAGALAVHVRTDALADDPAIDALLDAQPDVVSVDLLADSPATYRVVTGSDRFERARAAVGRMLERRRAVGGIPLPWIVPRLTRCDAVYEEIEPFYDRWIMAAGAAVLDPLPRPMPGERIQPL